MSLYFSDTSTLRGIIQTIEAELGFEPGFISGNATLLKRATADVNLSWDDYMAIALKSSGEWQYDDSNHTDYPFIKTNLVDGRRDYTFTTDETGNLILDVYKVAILPSSTATEYQEIFPVDQQTREHGDSLVAESTAEGVPFRYDKTGNGIFLDPVPSYNATNGLKVYINREPSYFTIADTTKKPGCPGIHHRYFALRGAEDYARRKELTAYAGIRAERLTMERSIEEYFSRRARDERPRITPKTSLYI